LLEAAEASLHTAVDLSDTLRDARAALDRFRQVGDSRGAVLATAVVVGALFRQASLEASPVEAIELAEKEFAAQAERGDRFGEATMKMSLAEIFLDRRDIPRQGDVLELAKEAKATFLDLGDRRMEAKATLTIAMVLVKRCDRAGGPKVAKEALKYAREASTMAQDLGDKHTEAKALYLMFSAKMYSEATFREGLKYGREALALFKQSGSRWWEATASRTIADWAQMKGCSQEGLQYAKDALAIFREVEIGRRMGWEASALASVVGILGARDDGAEEAMEVAKEGVDRLRASGDKFTEAQAWHILSSAHSMCEDFDEALKAAEESRKLYSELGHKECEARLLKEISDIHAQTENGSEALNVYRDSVAVFREVGDVRHEARSLSSIVRMHIGEEDPDKALEVASEAIALYQQCGDKEGQGVVLLNMSSAHMAKGALDAAEAEAEEARALFQDMESKDREAQSLLFLSEVHTRSDRPELALTAATAAKALYQKVGNKAEEANMLYTSAQCSFALAEKASNSAQPDSQRRVRKFLTAALKAGKEGLAIARRLPSEMDPKSALLVALLTVVAQAQGALGKNKEALRSANEVMTMSTAQGDRAAECSANLVLAQVHNWNGQVDTAKSFAVAAFDLAEKLKDEYLQSVAANLLNEMEPQAASQPAARTDTSVAPTTGADSAAADAGGAIGPYAGPTVETLIPKINELAMALLSSDELFQDTPLMDSGLDSLSMVQFRNTLQQQFPGVPMPASLVFDHPSVRAVSENIVEELKAAHDAGRPLGF